MGSSGKNPRGFYTQKEVISLEGEKSHGSFGVVIRKFLRNIEG